MLWLFTSSIYNYFLCIKFRILLTWLLAFLTSLLFNILSPLGGNTLVCQLESRNSLCNQMHLHFNLKVGTPLCNEIALPRI